MDITLTLDPRLLTNPDAELRYTIPDMLESKSNKSIVDNGYDYDDDDKMIIFMKSDGVTEAKVRELIINICNELKLENEALTIEFHA